MATSGGAPQPDGHAVVKSAPSNEAAKVSAAGSAALASSGMSIAVAAPGARDPRFGTSRRSRGLSRPFSPSPPAAVSGSTPATGDPLAKAAGLGPGTSRTGASGSAAGPTAEVGLVSAGCTGIPGSDRTARAGVPSATSPATTRTKTTATANRRRTASRADERNALSPRRPHGSRTELSVISPRAKLRQRCRPGGPGSKGLPPPSQFRYADSRHSSNHGLTRSSTARASGEGRVVAPGEIDGSGRSATRFGI